MRIHHLFAGLFACLVSWLGGTTCTGPGGPPTDGPTTTTTAPVTTTTTPPPPPPSAYADSWSAVHADARNSDWSPVEPADDVSLRWTIRIPGSIQIGPLPWTINLGPTSDPDGNLYVTSTEAGCHLRALDGRSGNTRWCAAGVDHLAVVSSPLIDRDGDLYLADGKGLHAFTADGEERWRLPLQGVPLSVQFTGDGHLVFVTHIGWVHVVDRHTGTDVVEPLALAPELVFNPIGGMLACARGTEACPAANTLAVDQATGAFFFTFWAPGADRAGLRAMRYVAGDQPRIEPLWVNDTLPGGTASSPALTEDGTRLYVTDNVDTLHAIDARTGTIVWSHRIGYPAAGSPSVSPEGLIIPAGGGASPLLAIRDLGPTAEVAWRHDDLLNRGIATQTAGPKVYATVDAGSYANDLVVLDATDGTILDRERLPGTPVFTVGTTVGNDGTVYVPAISGGLHAYR